MSVKIFTKYVRPTVKFFDEHSDVNHVETKGYRTAEQRITEIMLAGQRLIESRAAIYDFDGKDVDLNFSDPTRSPNYDRADATQDAFVVNARLKAARKVAYNAVKGSQEPSKGSQEPSKGSQEPIAKVAP